MCSCNEAMTVSSRLDQFRHALAAGGLHEGLRFLNASVEHRYTCVFRLVSNLFVNVDLYDKECEVMPEFLAEVPLTDSFCQFVIRDGVFLSSHTGQDHRLDGHKYQGVLLSYHGVPVLDSKGDLFGTLCHLDATSRQLPDEEFELLQAAARVIPDSLARLETAQNLNPAPT